MMRFTHGTLLSFLFAIAACAPAPGGDGPDAGAPDSGVPDAGSEDGGSEDGGSEVDENRTSATVGPEGGVLTLDGTTLLFQVGSLAEDTEVVLAHAPDAGPDDAVGGVWRIEPEDLVLGSRAVLRLPVPPVAGDPVLFWNRHPDFGEGLERLDGWREGDEWISSLAHLGSGHLAPAGGVGVTVHVVEHEVWHTAAGLRVVPADPAPDYAVSATLDGIPGQPMERGTRISRFGPLPPDATSWVRCTTDLSTCNEIDLGRPRFDAGVRPGRPVAQTTATLTVEADGLQPMDYDATYRFTGENTADYAHAWAGDLLDTGAAAVGDTSAALTFEPQFELDPAHGDLGWVFESREHTDALLRSYDVLVGFAPLEGLTIPLQGETSVAATLEGAPLDDVFTVQLDAAAWRERLPEAETVRVELYASWSEYIPDAEWGTALATLTLPLAELGSAVTIDVPRSPVPGWRQFVALRAGDLTWELPRSEVDGKVLPAPPIGLPEGFTLNGQPAVYGVPSDLDPTQDLVAEWQAPASGVDPLYTFYCFLSAGDTRLRWRQTTADTRVVIPAKWLAQLSSGASGVCLLAASRPIAPLTKPVDEFLQCMQLASLHVP